MYRKNAFTILEVMMASTILAVALIGTMIFLNTMTQATTLQKDVSELEMQSTVLASNLADELRAAWVFPSWNNSVWQNGDNAIQFLVPVDHDGDGDVFDAAMNVQWGSVREDQTGEFMDESHEDAVSTRIFYTILRFVQTSTYSEATENFDLNGNGVLTDVFALGHIEKFYPAGTAGADNATSANTNIPAFTKIISGENVVQFIDPDSGLINPAGLIDNDQSPDPLFFQTGSTLQLRIFLARTDKEEPLLQKLITSMELRNE
jgi:type II secretory pathway pseudopilin PulG